MLSKFVCVAKIAVCVQCLRVQTGKGKRKWQRERCQRADRRRLLHNSCPTLTAITSTSRLCSWKTHTHTHPLHNTSAPPLIKPHWKSAGSRCGEKLLVCARVFGILLTWKWTHGRTPLCRGLSGHLLCSCYGNKLNPVMHRKIFMVCMKPILTPIFVPKTEVSWREYNEDLLIIY